jgi:hypothetical protein
MKRASDQPDTAHRFTLPYEELRPAEGFFFQVFGRVVEDPLIPYWQLEPTAGLDQGLKAEVWWMSVAVGSTILATLQYDPHSGKLRKIIEIVDEGVAWERDAGRIVRAVRALQMRTTKPGPKQGTGARYRSREEWHQGIRDKVLTKQTRLEADDTTVAYWLGISTTLMYDLMKRWGLQKFADLREGNF